jgi:hypothetical protein
MIPAPTSVTEKIARRAVEIAQTIGPRKTGNALASLVPVWHKGVVGIEVPFQSSYLLGLNDGYTEKTMVHLSNKIIPIRQSDGSIEFRRVNPSMIGRVPIITRSAKDGKIIKTNPRWVRPSAPGTEFLQKSLITSIQQWERTVSNDEIIEILRQTDAQEYLDYMLNRK